MTLISCKQCEWQMKHGRMLTPQQSRTAGARQESYLTCRLALPNLPSQSLLWSKGVAECGKETNTRFFFFRGLLDTPPPSTFLIEYVFPMLIFSEILFYINNLLRSAALCGIRFIDANNSTLAIRYRRYASWVTNGFRKDGSSVYWWK